MKLNPRQSICLRSGTAILAGLQVFAGLPIPASSQASDSRTNDAKTASPIKHVIVIIGENRTFDHVFATYQAKDAQYVDNLLSKHIIKADGTPGPDFYKARQLKATDTPQDWELEPNDKSRYKVLPPPLVGGPTTPYITSIAQAKAVENGLASGYYKYLTTGGTGLPAHTIDTRIANATSLPPGPFQLTPGVGYDDYAASPVHRFYQMWQQLDCNAALARRSNNSGCKADLFPWVEVTVGAGSNGKPQLAGFNDMTTGEGSTSMGFYNVQQGDAPYLKYLADHYAMSDNYHQAGQGGTGINHILLGYSDDIYFSDSNGKPAVPPANQVENPNPQPGTNNYYTQDGYNGGSYSNCSDPNAPGVQDVLEYEGNLPYHVNPNCQKGAYYILNNYNPGYFGNGKVAYGDPNTTAFTIPPVTTRNIGNALMEKGISFKYYGDQWNRYVNDPYGKDPTDIYCNICNFLQYSKSIMSYAAVRNAHIQDTTDLYSDIQNGTVPAVSWVKPSGLVDGHPASSKLDLYEGFVRKIVDMVKSNKELWESTAIFVTFDEGGGYYDSGYVQPVDFFGDGTRVPMIVVSPFTRAGYISHQYNDHVSINKFIERNWGLKPLTMRSRDNLPNPTTDWNNPYVPTNSPAIGDMFDLFDFGRGHHGDGDRD